MKNFKTLTILLVALCFASALGRPSTKTFRRVSSIKEEVEGKRLIKINEHGLPKWLNEEEIFSLIRDKVKFMDITGRTYPTLKPDSSASKAIPTTLRFQSVVNGAATKLNIPRMVDFVTKFSAYTNRYYNNNLGQESSQWLFYQLVESVMNSTNGGNVTVEVFNHSWRQQSIIARLEGSNSSDTEVVVLGAHQDSINGQNPVNGVAPGADDNASGSVALLEAFRALLESGFIPKKTIEFHWYAAEEIGLRGSQDIAESYYNQGVKVIGMMNFDVVGYYVGIDQVAIYTDYTDKDLTQFLRLVVEGYLKYTWANSQCGYGCSDHASWTEYGFPAAFPAEAVDFPYMHTTRDTIDNVNFDQVLEFAKLALGYAIEMAEPSV